MERTAVSGNGKGDLESTLEVLSGIEGTSWSQKQSLLNLSLVRPRL
jgi:hypothetical protein